MGETDQAKTARLSLLAAELEWTVKQNGDLFYHFLNRPQPPRVNLSMCSNMSNFSDNPNCSNFSNLSSLSNVSGSVDRRPVNKFASSLFEHVDENEIKLDHTSLVAFICV